MMSCVSVVGVERDAFTLSFVEETERLEDDTRKQDLRPTKEPDVSG